MSVKPATPDPSPALHSGAIAGRAGYSRRHGCTGFLVRPSARPRTRRHCRIVSSTGFGPTARGPTIHSSRCRFAARLNSSVRPHAMKPTALAVLLALSFSDSAASLCIEPPIEVAFRQSDVVVAATVEAVSLMQVDGAWQQTILWHVDEAWKGRHYKGSRFTTRTKFSEPEGANREQSFLLLLSGSEPYAWGTCVPNRRNLQESLPDVHKLYQEFYRLRQPEPNNSFKPTPLRGAA